MNAVDSGTPALDLAFVAAIVAGHAPFSEADIICSLQEAQDHYGCLPQPVLDELARLSGFPVAKFYGVATFYAQFHLTPHGRHTVRVCRGTACHVRGAPKVMDAVVRHLGVGDGETTPDMCFSLETVACLGTCFLSPVMLVDDRYYGNLTPEKAVKVLESMAKSRTGQVA
jgi:NADH-quinone oxidoreductase subunit E